MCGLAAGVGGYVLGPWVAWPVTLACAYVLGRVHQSRRDMQAYAEERVRDLVEPFVEWAEEALASAPEDLDPEEELLRRRLQADYHAAQELLRELEK